MPLLMQYKSMFGQKPDMSRVLALIYTDILEFHKKAVKSSAPTWAHRSGLSGPWLAVARPSASLVGGRQRGAQQRVLLAREVADLPPHRHVSRARRVQRACTCNHFQSKT
jgi:hypothetical protein